MKKTVFLLILLIFPLIVFCQDTKEKLSVDFNNVDMQTAIQIIEKNSPYKFYFESEWFENKNLLVNGTYANTSLTEILGSIFKDTDLNFFIQNNKVILTNKSIIYDKLPDTYFGSTAMEANKQTIIPEKPIFHKQYDTINNPENYKNESLVFIGKETKSADKKYHTLSGYIKNLKTAEPLSNISIRIRKENISTVTNVSGYYTFQVPHGINLIEIESVSHKKRTKKVMSYNDGTMNLSLEENINVLNEVILFSKKRDNIKSAIVGVTTIDIEGIKNIPLILGERDIFRVATTLPGVKTVGEGAAGFNVRGGKEDQNLILLDDALVYNPSHFFGLFSAVNPFTTNKASIYKGSIPAEFGGRLSSVFDIETKNANTEKITGEGGIGPVTSNLTIGTPIVKGKSSLLVGGRATYSEWILKSLEDEKLKNSKASFYDAIVKYNHKINPKNTLGTTLYYSHDAFSITSDSLYKYSNRLAAVNWEHTFDDKNKGAMVITSSEYKFNIDYEGNNSNSFDFGYTINETQLLLKMNSQWKVKHKLNYGFASKLYNINPGTLSPTDPNSQLEPITIEKERGLESAVYISDNYTINKKLLIDVGLRYSFYASLGESNQRIYQEGVPINDVTVIETKHFGKNEVIKTYGGLEPRIAMRYFLTDNFSVKMSYDKANQYIHLLSSNTTQSPTDTWKLSDLNVKPQTSQQFSLGFYKNLKNDLYELSVEGYYKKSNNFLDYKVAAELLLNENIETELLQGKGKAYGVEFLLKKQSGKLNGWIGYTYSRTFIKLDSAFNDEKVNNGDYFPANFDKPHDVSLVLNYKFTKRYSFSSNFVYQTGRPITYPIGTYVYNNTEYTLYSDRNKFRIPDYFRLDVGLNIEGNHKIKKLAHSFWNISVYNVLGRNNPYSVYFVTDDGKIKAYKTSIFSIPIPTITYNFKF